MTSTPRVTGRTSAHASALTSCATTAAVSPYATILLTYAESRNQFSRSRERRKVVIQRAVIMALNSPRQLLGF